MEFLKAKANTERVFRMKGKILFVWFEAIRDNNPFVGKDKREEWVISTIIDSLKPHVLAEYDEFTEKVLVHNCCKSFMIKLQFAKNVDRVRPMTYSLGDGLGNISLVKNTRGNNWERIKKVASDPFQEHLVEFATIQQATAADRPKIAVEEKGAVIPDSTMTQKRALLEDSEWEVPVSKKICSTKNAIVISDDDDDENKENSLAKRQEKQQNKRKLPAPHEIYSPSELLDDLAFCMKSKGSKNQRYS